MEQYESNNTGPAGATILNQWILNYGAARYHHTCLPNCCCNREPADVTKQSSQVLQCGASMCYDTKLVDILIRNAWKRKEEKTLCSEQSARSTVEKERCLDNSTKCDANTSRVIFWCRHEDLKLQIQRYDDQLCRCDDLKDVGRIIYDFIIAGRPTYKKTSRKKEISSDRANWCSMEMSPRISILAGPIC